MSSQIGARAGRRRLRPDRHVDAGSGAPQVTGVVDGAALYGHLSLGVGGPGVAPLLPALRRVQVLPPSTETSTPPTTPPVSPSVAVPVIVSGSPSSHGGAVRGRDDRRGGSGLVVRGRGRLEVGLQAGGLDAHVGEEVDRRLLHARVGSGAAEVVVAVKSPGPLHRARAEDEGVRPRPLVSRYIVREWVAVPGAYVEPLSCRRSMCYGGRRHPDQACRPGAVVEVLVPLVADGAIGEGGGLARGQVR